MGPALGARPADRRALWHRPGSGHHRQRDPARGDGPARAGCHRRHGVHAASRQPATRGMAACLCAGRRDFPRSARAGRRPARPDRRSPPGDHRGDAWGDRGRHAARALDRDPSGPAAASRQMARLGSIAVDRPAARSGTAILPARGLGRAYRSGCTGAAHPSGARRAARCPRTPLGIAPGGAVPARPRHDRRPATQRCRSV